MRLAQVLDGLVVNVIVVEVGELPDWCTDWPVSPEAGPGWRFDGETFYPPEDPSEP